MSRYVLILPSMYLLPVRWGQKETFDHPGTVFSVLLPGTSILLSSSDIWAG